MIAALLISTSYSHAGQGEWTGYWLGNGTITDSGGKKSNCGTMQMLMREDRDGDAVSFYLPAGFPDCGRPSVLRSTLILEARGHELCLEDRVVGEFSGVELQLVRSTDWGSVFFKEDISLKRNAQGELVYRKILTIIDEGVYVIEGTLAPVN